MFGEVAWYPEGGLGRFRPEYADRELEGFLILPAYGHERIS